MGMSSRKERLFVQDHAAAAIRDMPQRVMPTADLPALSEASQQELFSQLLDVLQGTSINSSVVVGAAASAAEQVPAAGTGGAPAVPTTVPVDAQVGAGWQQPQGCEHDHTVKHASRLMMTLPLDVDAHDRSVLQCQHMSHCSSGA
jgi:hypothetical protein